ncbi:MAG: hypothetical protein AMXMBFR78_11310 [Rubrivivax sp.]|jgi:hypothetical protein|nr:hypothetical protein [Rubrivivax sp.]
MKITMEVHGLTEVQKALTERFSPRRLNAVMATALTRTAQDVREAVRQELPRVFDRPTPYTLNSLFVRPATAQRLQSEVYFRDELAEYKGGIAATKYLLPQVEGGSRNLKRFEVLLRQAGHLPPGWFAVPGDGARLDAYGNVNKGQIIQVLSQLRITAVGGFTRNMRFEAGKQIAAQRRAGGRFFVIKPGGQVQPGVYQREFTGRSITPVCIFVRRATYRPRLDFEGIATKVATQRLPGHVQRAIDENLARLAGSGR